MPKKPNDHDVLSVNALGTEISSAPLKRFKRARYYLTREQLTWDVACINHYAIRSLDTFLMKNDRGDGMAHDHKKYRVNSVFFRRHNKNAVSEFGILNKISHVDALISEWLKDPELRSLDQNALRIFQERRDQFLTPERIKELEM